MHSRSTGPESTGASDRLWRAGGIPPSACRQVPFSAAGQPFITLTGPAERTAPGHSVPFNCTAGTFSSQDIHVTWMKDWDEHPASAQRLVTDDKGNYSVTSKVWLTLLRQDVSAEITCQVTHRDLAAPLHRTMNLSQVLRGEWAGGRGIVSLAAWLPQPSTPFAHGKRKLLMATADQAV